MWYRIDEYGMLWRGIGKALLALDIAGVGLDLLADLVPNSFDVDINMEYLIGTAILGAAAYFVGDSERRERARKELTSKVEYTLLEIQTKINKG